MHCPSLVILLTHILHRRNKLYSSVYCCRSNNPTLLQFLLSLKDANEENSHQQQIVLATLKACPDLVISYLNGLSYAFEPKLSSKWISNVEYILQVMLCVCACVCACTCSCVRVCVETVISCYLTLSG